MLQKRGLSKKAVYLLVLLIVEIIGLWAIMSINAQALESGYAELKNRPQIDTTGSQIGSEYAFSPTISAQTQISLVTKNTTNCKNTELKDTGDHVFQFQPQDSSKATKIQMLYTNVGFSNTGKVLDARVDVEVNGVVSFTVSQIGHVKTDTTSSSKASAMQARVSITFLDHAQSTPTLVSGHLTFGNINSLKVLNVRLGMFNKIYCKDNCELWYQDLDDTTNITSQSNEHPKDKRDSFTGTFENQSTVAYSFTGTTYKEIDSGFDLGSVTDVAIPKINKSGSEEKAPADKSGLVVYKKRLLYTIQQNLPSKSAGYLSSYKIEDTISKYWQVSEIKVTDEANTDQTKNFDYTISQADAGSKLQITAKTSALNNVDFYGHFYNFNIYGSFAQDDKGQLISSITEQFNSTNNSGFLGQPNQAKVTYRVNNTANDVTNETKENGAVNKIALQGPQLSKLQCVNGEKNKVAGIVQDPACDKAGEAVPLTFWINYTNTAGKVIQNKPLLINGSNTLSNKDPGQQINFTADLPTDIQSTGSSYQGVTIIVKDKYGLQKQIPLTVNYWWGLSTDDQDQIELDIYDHTASSGFASKKDWPWDAERSTINKVDFKGKLAVQGALNGMFYQMTNLKQITNLKNLDTSNVTSMDSLFRQTALTSLDLGTTFDTSQVTNMSAMFDSCKKLTSLKGLNNFQTQNVTDMSYMFRHSGLTTLDLTNFDTAKVTNMTSMFQSMNNLTQLNISSFQMDKINKTPASSNYPDQYGTVRMFAGDSQLSQLTLGPNNRFPDDPGLGEAQLVDDKNQSHSTKWQAVAGGTVDNPQGKPLTAQQLIALYQDQGKPVQETYVWPWWELTTGDQGQVELDIYDHTASSGFASKSAWPWDAERSTINKVDFKGKLAVQGALNGMFYQMTNLKQITNLKNLDTSNVTSMDSLFRQTALTSLDLGTTFDTSQVTNMSAMFDSCKKLTSLKGLNNFQTQNVTDMSYMFRHSGLTTLDLTNFDTAKVTNMTSMFQSMNNLTQLNISSFRMDKINKTPTSSNYPDQYGTVKMFDGDFQLFQLTLGPNNHFPDDPKLDNAKPVDENEEGPHTTKWQAVAGGTVDNPQGTPLTAQQLIALYQDQGKPVQETYVWDHTWWQFDSTNGTLILYPRSNLVFNSSGKQAPKWPWDKTNWKNSQVKTVILKGPIKIQGSLQSMFAHMHNLSKIDHLDYLDTSSVNNMRAMFWDTGLKTLDISSFDMLQVQDTAAMFLKTPNLYKITIGKKAQFVHQHNDDSVFSLPGHSNFYIEGKQYSNTSDNWQEIDETDPNSFQIIGSPKSVAELNNYKSNDDKSHTFIWEPVETGTLSIAQVPQNLQYQVINLQPFLQQLLTSSSNSSKQEITVKDNRSLRTQRQKDAGWTAIKIKTSGTLSNDTSTISYFLKLQDTANPKTTGRELILAKPSFKKIDTTEATNYTWQPAASDPGIQLQLNLKTPPVNLLGQYTGKLTYELDNSVQ